MTSYSEHLLRTMAAVPPGQHVLVLEDPAGQHADPLDRLGFRVQRSELDGAALSGYGEEHFAWIVMHGVAVGSASEALVRHCEHLLRLLRSGGWLYVALPAHPLNVLFGAEPRSTDGVRALMDRAGLAIAERPVLTEINDEIVVRGIFRRVDGRAAA